MELSLDVPHAHPDSCTYQDVVSVVLNRLLIANKSPRPPPMIIRAIFKNPALLDSFDWFNDGKDTINWLKGIHASMLKPQTNPMGQAIADCAPEIAAIIALMEKEYAARNG